MSKKAGTATNIILEFVASKLWDIAGLFLVAAIIYLFFILFYSNMVMYLNLFEKSADIWQFGYLFLGLIFTAIFFIYALLVIVFVLSSILSLVSFKASLPRKGFVGKNIDRVKKAPVIAPIGNMISGFLSRLGRIFQRPETGNASRKWLLVLGSLCAFYYSWSIYPLRRSLNGLEYNFLPNSYLETSRAVYITVKPYVATSLNLAEVYSKVAYDFMVTNLSGLV